MDTRLLLYPFLIFITDERYSFLGMFCLFMMQKEADGTYVALYKLMRYSSFRLVTYSFLPRLKLGRNMDGRTLADGYSSVNSIHHFYLCTIA